MHQLRVGHQNHCSGSMRLATGQQAIQLGHDLVPADLDLAARGRAGHKRQAKGFRQCGRLQHGLLRDWDRRRQDLVSATMPTTLAASCNLAERSHHGQRTD